MNHLRIFFLTCMISTSVFGQAKKPVVLQNNAVQIQWQNGVNGLNITSVKTKKGGQWTNAFNPSGEYTLLYTDTKPSSEPKEVFEKITGGKFPEDAYHYQQLQWKESTTEVALNTAGKAYHFFPESESVTENGILFSKETDIAKIQSTWQLDPQFPSDIRVTLTLTAKKDGFYSLASPTLGSVETTNMQWVSVPGYFQGNYMQPNFALAYAYGHGIPTRPVVYRERCASTLSPLVTSKNNVTLSVIPEPGLARDPWAKDKITQTDWLLGLSHMNRKAQLSPTLYYPVLGEETSKLTAGQQISFSFRYSLQNGDWFSSLKHAANDIYDFHDKLELRKSKQSLTDRIEKMHHYLTDPKTSLWNIEQYKGLEIGAQSYLGGVVGSNKDAMKNSDYGAMFMLAKETNDPKLRDGVLPPALNFKLVQQQTTDGFFKGAVEGQYYLAKSKKFVEEWGEVVEPIAVTYYVMLDIGNMLLFEPNNNELRERLKEGADRLLAWQKTDGSWAVAYDHKTEEELFKDIKDYRPTFYGLLVAYQILKDPKYLESAKKGADWFLKNGVDRGSFLGVCGDARYAPDFATGQSAQAYLDLFDITKDVKYKTAAIQCAKIYTASIYTHPIASHKEKLVNGTPREDWEISQTGLSFEHGGIFGSAVRNGPIQLASHAGMFIRIHQLTGEQLFADMARSAAIGRDAFVDSKTSVASYYWQTMNKGAGPYPHHAWWQIGWISDYLLSEANFRSKGKISFPRGFVTPKVGPHQTYGFEAGNIYGNKAQLAIIEDLIDIDNTSVDYIISQSEKTKTIYVTMLNNEAKVNDFALRVNEAKLPISNAKISEINYVDFNGAKLDPGTSNRINIPAFGIRTISIKFL